MMFWNRPLFKEQWPYFRRHPVRWTLRWWRIKSSRKETVLELDHRVGAPVIYITRLPGETDEMLRVRIKQTMLNSPNR